MTGEKPKCLSNRKVFTYKNVVKSEIFQRKAKIKLFL